MTWNYAELSKAASKAGGPEKLMNVIMEAGKKTGHKEMMPVVAVAAVLGALGYAGVQKVVGHFKQKEKESAEAVQAAKEELIQGIKDYDTAHPEIENTEGSLS